MRRAGNLSERVIKEAGYIGDTKMHFLISETGFSIETKRDALPENEAVRYWFGRFKEDRYRALYNLGFNEKPEWLDSAGTRLFPSG